MITFNFSLFLIVSVFILSFFSLLDFIYLSPKRKKAVKFYKKTANYDNLKLIKLEKKHWIFEYSLSLLPVFLIVLIFRSFLIEPFQIPSGSMKPTLEIGDFVLVNKFYYGIRLPILGTKIISINSPQRGDILVFRYPSNPSINYIKRVIAVPGDTIKYTAGKRIYINDQVVAEELVGEERNSLGSVNLYKERLNNKYHLIRKELNIYNLEQDKKWTVPKNYYFMLGDNRDNSNDSRYWNDPNIPQELHGMVSDKNIVGKAFAIWLTWPSPKLYNLPTLSRIGLLK